MGGSVLSDTSGGWLQGFGYLLGLDGYIILAFILGLPANEIVIPILIMSYLSEGVMLEPDSLEASARSTCCQWVDLADGIKYDVFFAPPFPLWDDASYHPERDPKYKVDIACGTDSHWGSRRGLFSRSPSGAGFGTGLGSAGNIFSIG